VAALVMLALLVSAGLWQLRRADAKRAILVEQVYRGAKEPLVIGPDLGGEATVDRLRHRLAVADGHYRADMQYLLDNRTHNQIAGYHVLTSGLGSRRAGPWPPAGSGVNRGIPHRRRHDRGASGHRARPRARRVR
jgi:hypothetical protein